MDNTLTGVAINTPDEATSSGKKGNGGNLKQAGKLGGIIALVGVVSGALANGAELSKSISDLIDGIPFLEPWTKDVGVVLQPRDGVEPLTLQECNPNLRPGQTMHIATLRSRDESKYPSTFVLEIKGKGCKGEGTVWMNPDDYTHFITEPRKADFEMSYTKAHLDSLDLLINDALYYHRAPQTVAHASGGK